MGIIIIEKNGNEVIRSSYNDTKLINLLKKYNHLDLHITKLDNIKIIFNNNTFDLNFNELYEIYEYDIKTLYTTTFESDDYFFFIDIVKFYNIHFIKGVFIYKKDSL
jgi:hypothetical protein